MGALDAGPNATPPLYAFASHTTFLPMPNMQGVFPHSASARSWLTIRIPVEHASSSSGASSAIAAAFRVGENVTKAKKEVTV